MEAVTNGHLHNGKKIIEKLKNGALEKEESTAPPNQRLIRAGPVKSYVPDLVKDEKELRVLRDYAVDYAHCIGLVGRTAAHKDTSYLADVPPLTLCPSPFPQELYEHGISVQKTLNELYFRVSMDHDFLVEAYKEVVKGDPFIGRLMEMMDFVHKEGIHQKVALLLERADYLSNWNEETKAIELKQVEVNIGSVGGPGLATAASKLHRQMLDKVDALHGTSAEKNGSAPGDKMPALKSANLPENRPRHRMAQTLYEAWKLFGDPQAVVLFVTETGLFPICHFEQLQFVVFQVEKLAKADGHHLNVLIMDMQECLPRLRLDETDFSLILDEEKKVALIHTAYGYLPEHYPTEKEWKLRLDMERSTAIVSPNIRVQMCCTKKIQQVLSEPGVLERFLPGEEKALAKLRQTYTDLWGLESNEPKTLAIIQEAIKTPGKFVLKAQLESGKGNYFDEELAEKLRTMSLEERGAYILQRKINPLVAKNYVLRSFKEPHLESVISEMGIYGSFLGDCLTGEVLLNNVDGHLLRSKSAEKNQGGLMEGSGMIDSLLLFPGREFQ